MSDDKTWLRELIRYKPDLDVVEDLMRMLGALFEAECEIRVSHAYVGRKQIIFSVSGRADIFYFNGYE